MKAPTEKVSRKQDRGKTIFPRNALWITAAILLVLIVPGIHVSKNLRLKHHREIAEAADALVDAGDAFQARPLLAEAAPDGDWKTLRDEPELAWSLYRAMRATEGRIHVPEPLSAMAVAGSGAILTLSRSGHLNKVILREWDPETGVPIRESSREALPTLENTYESAFAFSPDGSRLLSERGVLFDTDGFTQLFELEDGPHWLSAFSFSPDGEVVAAREYGDLSVWDVRTGERRLTIKNAFKYRRDILRDYTVLFSPDGEYLAFTPAPGGVGVLRMDGSDHLRIVPATDSVKLWSTKRPMQEKVPEGSRILGFSGDGRLLLTQDEGHGLRAWDPASGTQTDVPDRETGGPVQPGRNGSVRQIDEKTISVKLTASDPVPVMVQSAVPWSSEGGSGMVEAVSPDWRLKASVRSFSGDGEVAPDERVLRIFETASGRLVAVADTLDSVFQLEFSPDGSRLLSFGADESVLLFDPRTGRKTAEWTNYEGAGILFSPKGRRLASFDVNNNVYVWDYRGRVKTAFQVENAWRMSINTIWFSPDGKTLACVGDGGILILLDVASGRKRVIEETDRDLVDADFSPDGSILATLSRDGEVCLWSRASGKLLWQVRFPEDRDLEFVDFNEEGSAVKAFSWEDETWSWDLPDFQALAKEIRGVHNSRE